MNRKRWHLIRLVYNLLLVAALPVLLLYLFYRWLRGKSREGWAYRMGYLPPVEGCPVVWVHAVSVGEAVAAEAVVRALRQRLPKAHLLYTAGTPEGRATAQKRMGDLLDHVAFVPYDLPWVVSRAMDQVRPWLFILMESELWPNLVQAAHDRGVPVMLANGYVSERTARKGQRVLFLYRWIFSNIEMLCVQSEAVKARVLALGAEPESVRVLGNVKYDQATEPLPPEQVARWRELLRIAPDEAVFLAGSTHPGEEEQVLRAWEKLRESHREVRFILAPRHPRRTEEVEALVQAAGHPVVRRSRLGQPGAPASPAADLGPDTVILLDTMGELAGLFSLATVVFLGGSLVPVGGHDILQPLIAGKPVILGPHTHNQRQTVEEALADGVVWQVANVEKLAERAGELIEACRADSHHERRAIAHVASRRGASLRCAEAAEELLRRFEAAP